MRKTRRPGNYPCQNILHKLKFQDVLEINTIIKGFAIVKSTTNKSSCNTFGDSKLYIPANIPANTTKVMNMIKQQQVCEICYLKF